MKNIKLFSDRMSHPSRFCIQFLKMNDIAYSEQKVDLLKGKHLILDYNDRYRQQSINFTKITQYYLISGENFKNPDLPFKKVPVLHAEINNQPIIIAQSTTILRSLCETLNNVDEKWFPKKFHERYRINEFIDFFHFSMNAVSHCNNMRIHTIWLLKLVRFHNFREINFTKFFVKLISRKKVYQVQNL